MKRFRDQYTGHDAKDRQGASFNGIAIDEVDADELFSIE